MRSFSKIRLSLVTAAAMAVATFPIAAFSVLAADLIDEFAVSRAQVGLLVTATALGGALTSPMFGRVTDRVGALVATRGVLALGTATLLSLALSPTYGILFFAAIAAGFPNGWTNPATNALIVDNVRSGERGWVTGVKQSGVQIGTFLGGLLLPPLTIWFGWRGAVAAFAIIPLSGLIGTVGRVGKTSASLGPRGQGRVPRSVRWVAVYGALSGFATAAMFGFIPLFAEEDQLWSPAAAGATISIVGFVGAFARIGWPMLSEKRVGHGPTLGGLSAMTMVSALLLAFASMGVLASWVLIPAAVFLGAGAIAWNAVGMLAVMDFSPPEMVGKSTGLVLLGFLTGLAGGAPFMGWSVDVFASYTPGWLTLAGLFLVSALVARKVPSRATVAAP